MKWDRQTSFVGTITKSKPFKADPYQIMKSVHAFASVYTSSFTQITHLKESIGAEFGSLSQNKDLLWHVRFPFFSVWNHYLWSWIRFWEEGIEKLGEPDINGQEPKNYVPTNIFVIDFHSEQKHPFSFSIERDVVCEGKWVVFMICDLSIFTFIIGWDGVYS